MAKIDSSTAGRRRLLATVVIRFMLAFLVLGLLLFVSAGSIKFWNAWIYLGALFFPMIGMLIYLYKHDADLLERRMRVREKEKEQKRYVKISLLIFVAAFIVPGLDFRFQWSSVPVWLAALSVTGVLLGYAMFVAVMVQNSYASRVIEVQEGQKVIETGLYSFVRHPLYLAAIILYLFSPLVLGSFFGIIPMLLLPILLAYRIVNEEKVLIDGLDGYAEYVRKVKYRLIPFIW